jgi:hypothetical protein
MFFLFHVNSPVFEKAMIPGRPLFHPHAGSHFNLAISGSFLRIDPMPL